MCQANCTEADAEFAEFKQISQINTAKEYVCVSACSSGLFTFYEVGVQRYICEEKCPDERPFALAWENETAKVAQS